MNFRTSILIVAGAVAGLTSTASAWTSYGEWGSNMIQMRASSVSFPVGSPFRTALGTIEDRVYNNPSEAWIDQLYGDTSLAFNNGQSEIWFSASATYNPAVTFPEFNWLNGNINEADVVFYAGDMNPLTIPFDGYGTSMTKTLLLPYGGANRPFETTCLHEYGHVLGLDHEDDEYNIMGQDWTHIHLNGSTCRSYLGEDAADGLVALYGRASAVTIEDVSVTHWKYDFASGGYSQHEMCDVDPLSGAIARVWSSTEGMWITYVNKNTVYYFEFSYENNGETTQSVDVGFYLSTNNYISTGDSLLKTKTFSLGRNSVYTRNPPVKVRIPSWATSGATYYLGAYVDYNNAISEVDGTNNRAYHVIRVN